MAQGYGSQVWDLGLGTYGVLVLCMTSVGLRTLGLKGLGMCPRLNQHGKGLFADYCPCATALVGSMPVSERVRHFSLKPTSTRTCSWAGRIGRMYWRPCYYKKTNVCRGTRENTWPASMA